MIKDPEDTPPYRPPYRSRLAMRTSTSIVVGLLILVMLLLITNCAGTIGAFQSTVTITSDRGGNISNYISKYKSWAAANKKIIVNGYCASSCTLFIAIVPPTSVCVTKNAYFGFHGAWDQTFFSGQVEDPAATLVMMSQ